MYESPITVLQRTKSMEIADAVDGAIYKAVLDVGVQVDKEELLKALQYDRNQYEKGYLDAKSEVIRCKDCKYHDDGWCFGLPSIEVEPDDFCCWGERKCPDEGC